MKKGLKKVLVVLVLLGLLGGGGYYGYEHYIKAQPPTLQLVTAMVSKGSVVQGIDATGRLQAVTTVQVGSQVSGTIKSLYADFNSQVKKGQVVAELEPSLFQTQVEQAEATVVRGQADVERSRVQLEDAKLKLTRARDLANRKLLPQADLETAEANNRQAEAALKSAQAQLVQGQASLNQNKVNMGHTVITAPIDGVVINRNVDVGQTVAASMQAPTLFEIANDLSQMQVNANISESDIGLITIGQPVRFQVDAYPQQTFNGTVAQVRLNPVIEQNVVSYVTVISVPNPELKLRPGMTANVTVEVARADDTLRVPLSAIRFTPTPELFASLGQPVPEALADNARPTRGEGPQAGATVAANGNGAPAGGREGSGGGRGREGSARANATDGAGREGRTQANATDGAGREGRAQANATDGAGREGRGGNDEDRQALRAKLQQMTPEERQAYFAARGGGRGGRGGGNFGGGGGGNFGGGGGGNFGGGGGGRRNGGNGDPSQGAIRFRGGGAGERRNSAGQVWLVADGHLKPVRVRVGITGGANVAVSGDDIHEGEVVATGIIETTAAAAPAGTNPLLPQGRGRGGQFFPGGNFGGGGGGGNRGGGGGGGGGNRGGGGGRN